MKPQARLQMYPPTGPKETGYIVADRAGLRQLAQALKNAADNLAGVDLITLYGADGHAYELLITCDATDEEWNAIGPNYQRLTPRVQSIQDFQEIRQEMARQKAG